MSQYGPWPGTENKDHQGHTLRAILIYVIPENEHKLNKINLSVKYALDFLFVETVGCLTNFKRSRSGRIQPSLRL